MNHSHMFFSSFSTHNLKIFFGFFFRGSEVFLCLHRHFEYLLQGCFIPWPFLPEWLPSSTSQSERLLLCLAAGAESAPSTGAPTRGLFYWLPLRCARFQCLLCSSGEQPLLGRKSCPALGFPVQHLPCRQFKIEQDKGPGKPRMALPGNLIKGKWNCFCPNHSQW